jgi:ribosome maturation protein SDO1
MSKEKPIVARLKVGGETFEALCHAHKVREYKEGKCKLEDVLVDTDNVYKHAHKGERWAAKDLEAAFETTDVLEILQKIVEKGAAQITTDEVREDIVKKRREVVHYIATKYVDPKSGRPHPPTRIESALDMVKGLSIDPKRSAQDITHEILRKLMDTGLALKKLEMEGTVSCKHNLQGPVQGTLHKMCTILGTSHSHEGVVFSIGINPGDLDEMLKELAKVTKGEFSFDLPDPLPAAKEPAPEGGGKKSGKKKEKN